MIFWKEAWLKRVETGVTGAPEFQYKPSANGLRGEQTAGDGVGLFKIFQAAETKNEDGEAVYFCQATEVLRFTSPMASWDPRQYVRDLRSGNISTGLAGDSWAGSILEIALGVVEMARAFVVAVFNNVQTLRHSAHYPSIPGAQVKNTSVEELNLQPGELVEVRSKEEIVATLNPRNRNRGLSFDSEMLRYCGGVYRVFRRVRRIVDEKTGKMLQMKNPCIILEGVWCRSDYHRFCPRAIFHYWREGWLKRAADVRHLPPTGMNETQEQCWKEISR